MTKKHALILLVIFSLSCLTLSPKPEEEEPASEPATLTDPAQPIEVQAGETFTIIIASNPSTGYYWQIVNDLNGVEFVSSEYQAEEPVMPGSGGVEVWTFKAISAGETQIILGSFPPGESDGEPQQSTVFDVIVK